MNQLKQAFLALWDSITNGTHLTTAEQQMIQQLRALGATDEDREALTQIAAVGATPELIRTFTKMTATGRITNQEIFQIAYHGIQPKINYCTHPKD